MGFLQIIFYNVEGCPTSGAPLAYLSSYWQIGPNIVDVKIVN